MNQSIWMQIEIPFFLLLGLVTSFVFYNRNRLQDYFSVNRKIQSLRRTKKNTSCELLPQALKRNLILTDKWEADITGSFLSLNLEQVNELPTTLLSELEDLLYRYEFFQLQISSSQNLFARFRESERGAIETEIAAARDIVHWCSLRKISMKSIFVNRGSIHYNIDKENIFLSGPTYQRIQEQIESSGRVFFEVHTVLVGQKLAHFASSALAGYVVAESFETIDSFLTFPNEWKLLSYFRNDHDLIRILTYVRQHLEGNNNKSLCEFLTSLSHFHSIHCNELLLASFKSFLTALCIRASKDQDAHSPLSRSISLIKNMVPPGLNDPGLMNILKQCLMINDSRVRGTALSAIGELDPKNLLFREFMNSTHNRVAADALIVLGKQELSTDVLSKLEEFLDSSNPFFIASGLYVLATLSEHYSYEDEGTLVPEHFVKLCTRVKDFSTHPNKMVQNRAMISVDSIETQEAA